RLGAGQDATLGERSAGEPLLPDVAVGELGAACVALLHVLDQPLLEHAADAEDLGRDVALKDAPAARLAERFGEKLAGHAELVGQAARDHLDAVAAPVLVVVADFLVTDPVADHLLQGTGQIADARHDLDRATQRLTLVLALDLAPLVKAKPLEVQPTVVVFV